MAGAAFKFSADGDRFKFERLFPIEHQGWDCFQSLNPSGHVHDWKPLPVEWKACMGEYDEDDAPPPPGLVRPDIATLSANAPAFNRRAIEVIEPLIRGHAQVLPLAVTNGPECYVLQVLTVVDGLLDEARCEGIRVGRNKEQLVVSKFALFHMPAGKAWPPIFRVGEDPKVCRFVNDDFRRAILANQLTGAEFVPVPLRDRVRV